MQDAEIKMSAGGQMHHIGNERLFKRTIIGPFGEESVDGGVVHPGPSVASPGYRQTLPLHSGVQHTG
jgi:hypothetical protein